MLLSHISPSNLHPFSFPLQVNFHSQTISAQPIFQQKLCTSFFSHPFLIWKKTTHPLHEQGQPTPRVPWEMLPCCVAAAGSHPQSIRSVLLLEMLEGSLLCSQMTLKYFYLENYFGELLEFTQENNTSQGDRKVDSAGCCRHSLRSLSMLLPSLSFPP